MKRFDNRTVIVTGGARGSVDECPASEVRLRKGVFEFSEDRICGGGPSKGVGVFVMLGKVGVNSGLKLSHRREASPAN